MSIWFKSQVNLEWIVYMCKRLHIETVDDLIVFIDYYNIKDEYDLLFKLWHEVDDVYYPIEK